MMVETEMTMNECETAKCAESHTLAGFDRLMDVATFKKKELHHAEARWSSPYQPITSRVGGRCRLG